MLEWQRAAERIADCVERRLGGCSLTAMAREVGYSPTYCSTVFRRVMGITLRDYMAGRRLALAAKRLRDTREPVVDVALRFGFSSQSAMTRAFRDAYGVTPGRYRKRPTPLPLQIRLHAPSAGSEGGIPMSERVVDVRTEYIPAHKYLGVFKRSETKDGPIWPGHDCDLLCGIIESLTQTDRIVTPYTAGWEKGGYFFGSGIDAEAENVVIPEGFELRHVPGSYYLVFATPPFKYPEENGDAMSRVEELAWNFDPAPLGLMWADGPCFQRHSPELLGYQVLRPVQKREPA